MSEPIHYEISESEFDQSLLPEASGKIGSDSFRKHVTRYFKDQYNQFGGQTTVEFNDGTISVTWMPAGQDQEPMEAILALLNDGQYDKAMPMLETLLQIDPNDYEILYNLGMVYSDLGRLNEAKELLEKATTISPEHGNSWVALGVAALRSKDTKTARPALEKAVDLEPDNPFALRTLGALLAMVGDYPSAILKLRAAITASPDDATALVTLAQTLTEVDTETHSEEADNLALRALELAPFGEIAEKAKDVRRVIAGHTFRNNAVGDVRHDAMMYCLGALERFESMNKAQLAPVIMEVATLGQSGLPVNDSSKKFNLRSLPGDFTALQLVCMLHVGGKKLDPNLDSGFDLAKEYEAALELHNNKKK